MKQYTNPSFLQSPFASEMWTKQSSRLQSAGFFSPGSWLGQLDLCSFHHLYCPPLPSRLLLHYHPLLLRQVASRGWRAKEHSWEGFVLDQLLLPPLLLHVAIRSVLWAYNSLSPGQLFLLPHHYWLTHNAADHLQWELLWEAGQFYPKTELFFLTDEGSSFFVFLRIFITSWVRDTLFCRSDTRLSAH